MGFLIDDWGGALVRLPPHRSKKEEKGICNEEMEGDGRRWKEMEGDGRRWKEMEGDGRRWDWGDGGGV